MAGPARAVGFTVPGPLAPLTCLRDSAQLVYYLTRRRIVTRYRGSYLGLAWFFASPAITLAIFTFVFGVLLQSRWDGQVTNTTEYALLLFLGLLVFWFVSECIGEAPGLILEHANYVKKVVFPIEVLPWVLIANALFNTAVRSVVFILAYVALVGLPPATILLLPFVWLPLSLATIGICWLLAALGVFLRDLREGVSLLLTAFLFLSPIFYSSESVPEAFRWLLRLNPITLPVEQARDLAFFGRVPDLLSWSLFFAISCVLAWVGYAGFARTRRAFADVL